MSVTHNRSPRASCSWPPRPGGGVPKPARRCGPALLRVALALSTGVSLVALSAPAYAQSAQPVVNLCSGLGVNLPVLQPVANVASGILGGVVDPLLNGLVGGINTNLVGALSGQPLSVSVLDGNGNLVSLPSGNCGFGITSNNGITLGGGAIDGLGGVGTARASAGDTSAIAIGNGAATGVGIVNALALGSGASATTAGGVALGSGSLANRTNSASELFTGTALRPTIGTVSVGSAGNERQITNVAGGTAATDAVNVRQLTSVGQNLATALGAGASSNATTGIFTAPSYVIGGTTYTNVGAALAAIPTGGGGTNPSGPGLVQQAGPGQPITVGAATDGTSVDFTGTAGARRLTGVAAGTVASGSTDAVNGGQLYNLSQTSVQYDVDPATGMKTNSVTLAGGDPNTPVLVRNVAPGILNTDAANVGQVKAAQQASFNYTDQRVSQTLQESKTYTDQQIANLNFGNDQAFSRLNQEIGQVRKEARQSGAIGLAAASLRYDDQPGKISLAAGGSAWRGEPAASFGLGYTTPDGFARFNAAATTAGGDWGIGGGLSITLN